MNRYCDYNSILKNRFGERVQKILVNAGFSCPNRDGTKGVGGCTYCNNRTFSPDYCQPHYNLTEQIEKGIAFFSHKYQSQKYLVYFQSYTNTYAPLSHLVQLYEEALAFPNVAGIVVGTRPDCVSAALLDYFAELAQKKYVMLEYGVESTSDETLRRINRGHDFYVAREAITETAQRGILVGAHLILGLPGESREQMLRHAEVLSDLPLTMLKLHQLQIVRGAAMEKQFAENPQEFHIFSLDEYIDLCVDFLERLNPEIAVERFVSQSPKEWLVQPEWGVKNFEFLDKLKKRLRERDTWQGKLTKRAEM